MANFKTELPQEGRSGSSTTNPSHRRNASVAAPRILGGAKNSFTTRNSNILRVGAWNVRSMVRKDKLVSLKKEMDRLKLDVVGITETRIPNNNDFWTDDFRVLYSGTKGHAGVGLIANKKVGNSISSYIQISDRILIIRLDTVPVNTTIIVVYMPTSKPGTEEEIEEVYGQINDSIEN